MPQKTEFHIPIKSDGSTALDTLANTSGLSRQKIKQAMQKGCVWIETNHYTQRLRRAKRTLSKGHTLHCYYDSYVLKMTPPDAQLVCDKGDYSIWNKPSGMLSQGSKWGDHCTLYRWAEKHLKPERPAFIVHRLDRAASGLTILAHKKKIASQFADMFQKHELEKHYEVWVNGDFSSQLTEKNPIKIITDELDHKPAESYAQLIKVVADSKSGQTQSLLDVEIKTGRKHQIRKHLAGLGFPVVGDRLYNANQKHTKNLQLKAILLRFDCPITGAPIVFKLEGE